LSDTVITALITTVGAFAVAALTQLVSLYNINKTSDNARLRDENKRLIEENGRLRKQSDEQQEIIDFYRKRGTK